MIKGKYEKIADDKIRVTELPIGTWTMPYTSFLETLMDGSTDKSGKKIAPSIKDFTSISTEKIVDFNVVFPKGKIPDLENEIDSNGCNGVEKLLKLTTTVSSTNMHMFDSQCKLKKYASVEEIIEAFYDVRMATYNKRKEYLMNELNRLLVKLSNRAKYIQLILNGTIDLRRKTSTQVTELLESNGLVKIEGDYKYLIKMPMDSVTQENVDNIMKEKSETEMRLEVLTSTTLNKMWLNDLDKFETAYDLYKKKRDVNMTTKPETSTTVKRKVVKQGGKK